ncbi:MAG: HEAT repeat domain-containing protein [Elusimicrobiota bacterium]|nr:HEAT repeat domain-containing protein [Elusimicrobiota bacterium]
MGALVALMLACAAAADDGVADALVKLRAEPEAPARVALVEALNKPPLRGPRAYSGLVETMERDLSDTVRLAAAKAVATWPGGEPLERLEKYLKTETGAMSRRDLVLALSTEPAHAMNPDATRLLASLLLDDPSPAVRRGAAVALALRRDITAIGTARKAAAADPDKEVRAVAAKAVAVLEKPPKAKAKKAAPPPPKEDAVKGKDPCRPPYGWCECGYPIIKTAPKCLTREDCRHLYINSYRRNNLSCDWDGQDMGTTE